MSAPIRVLELRSVRGTGGGPDKTILAGARLADPARFDTTVCYIRDARDTVFALDQRAAALGVKYVEVVERHSFDRRIWPALRRLVRELGIDIVHAHDHKTDALTWALARAEPIIPLSTAHGFAGETWNERIYYAVEKRLLTRFPKVIAVSVPIRNELLRTGSHPDRVVVINNAIDPEQFRRSASEREEVRQSLGIPAGAVLIGAVGRLEVEKRFEVLLEAVARLRGSVPALVVAIAGEGSMRPMLEATRDRLGLGPACRLLGHQTDVRKLHQAFDLLVQSSEREGTPNAVLEAMAMETPIVATDVGGTGELVTDGVHGLLVPAGDAGRLTEAIAKALADDATPARTAAARRRVETELSFEQRMRRVEAIYTELVEARARTRAAEGSRAS